MKRITPFRQNKLSLSLDEYWEFVERHVEKSLKSSRLKGHDFKIILSTHATSTESSYFYIYDFSECRFMVLRISTHQSIYLTGSSFIRTQDFKNVVEFQDKIVDFVLNNRSYVKMTRAKGLKFMQNYTKWEAEERSIFYSLHGQLLMYWKDDNWCVIRNDEYAGFIRTAIQFGWILPIRGKSKRSAPRQLISLRGFDKIAEFVKTEII